MVTLTIQNFSDEVHRSLRVRDNSLFIAMGLTVINPWHAMSLPN
jgi:hypothetical protein